MGVAGAAAAARWVNDEDVEVRSIAVQTLGRLGLVPHVVLEKLGDGDAHVRVCAVLALGGMKEPNATHAEAVAARLEADDETMRAAAAQALGRMGGFATVHTSAIAERMTDQQATVRASALHALGLLGQGGPWASEMIDIVLRDSSSDVRNSAIAAMSAVHPRYLQPHLRRLRGMQECREITYTIRRWQSHAFAWVWAMTAAGNGIPHELIQDIADLL